MSSVIPLPLIAHLATPCPAVSAIAVRVMPKLTLSGDISWINYNDDGSYGENANLYRYGVGADYTLSPQATLSLRYEYTDKDSNVDYNSYDRNFVKLTLTYRF